MTSAVVLAAGASSRMGSPKLLLPLGDESIVRRTVRQVGESGFDDVLVVTGREHDRIVAALDGLDVRYAMNPDYATGMGSSFRTGVAALTPDCEAAMFALADQPFVTSREYRAIRETYALQLPPIVGSRFGDVTAPPHLFARSLFPELSVLQHGARTILRRHESSMIVLHFPPGLLLDIDTPEDYERACVRVAAER